jgi:hypothetical protein
MSQQIVYPEEKSYINYLGESSVYTTQVLTSPEVQMKLANGGHIPGTPISAKTRDRLLASARAVGKRKRVIE